MKQEKKSSIFALLIWVIFGLTEYGFFDLLYITIECCCCCCYFLLILMALTMATMLILKMLIDTEDDDDDDDVVTAFIKVEIMILPSTKWICQSAIICLINKFQEKKNLFFEFVPSFNKVHHCPPFFDYRKKNRTKMGSKLKNSFAAARYNIIAVKSVKTVSVCKSWNQITVPSVTTDHN